MTDWPTICRQHDGAEAQIEALLRAAAPLDYPADRPLYAVIDDGELGKWAGPASGLTIGTFLDLMLQPRLEAEGRWDGRGAAMLVSPAPLPRMAATGLQELTHILEHSARVPLDDLPRNEWPDWADRPPRELAGAALAAAFQRTFGPIGETHVGAGPQPVLADAMDATAGDLLKAVDAIADLALLLAGGLYGDRYGPELLLLIDGPGNTATIRQPGPDGHWQTTLEL